MQLIFKLQISIILTKTEKNQRLRSLSDTELNKIVKKLNLFLKRKEPKALQKYR